MLIQQIQTSHTPKTFLSIKVKSENFYHHLSPNRKMTVNGSYYLLTFSEPASRNFNNSPLTFTFKFVPKNDYKKAIRLSNHTAGKLSTWVIKIVFRVIFQKIDEKEDING